MKKIALILLLTITAFAIAKDTSNTLAYEQGLHYKVLDPAYDTENDKQVVVYEFFGYKCPHCASFQPYMQSLHKDLPDYVKVVRVPLGFNPIWKTLAQGYYAAESMGVLEKSHQAMFDALHKQHKKLRSIEDIADWYAEQYGVEKDKFLSTANSFMVDGMITKGNNIAIKMQIPNTPKLVINGKFMPEVTALGNNAGVIELAKVLIQQEAKAMGLVE